MVIPLSLKILEPKIALSQLISVAKTLVWAFNHPMWSESKDIDRSINPRDFVELLDKLIKLRVEFPLSESDDVEMIKRQMTDYLLETSAKKGIYFKDTR